MKQTLLYFSLLFFLKICAQIPGDVAQNFGACHGFNETVKTIVIQTDGKIIVGGLFTNYNGITVNRIIRLNPDGTKDTSFNAGTGFNYWVTSIALQTDGKIIVGGEFTTYYGVTENRIIRLNPDGTKDTSFNTGTGFNNSVLSISIQTDGKIIVGGNFTNYNGVTENKIIRLNTDGTKDTSFNSGIGFDSSVWSTTIQTDGKIIVGGDFTGYNGITENKIIRLNTDGTKDNSFNTGTGFNSSVVSIIVQADGKILIGGGFTTYNGVTENKIIRLNTDGTKDSSFNTGIGFDSSVLSTTIQTDGKILVGGDFTSYNGLIESKIIRLNINGTKDLNFNTGSGIDNYNPSIGKVYSIVVQSNDIILLGGNFYSYNGENDGNYISLNTNGTKNTSFSLGTGFNKVVKSIAVQTNGKILVGGQFTVYNRMNENAIICLNPDSTKDTSFISGTGFNSSVNAFELQTDGKILVVGEFTTYKGVTENRIIRLNTDGTKDTSFNTGTGFNNYINSIKLQLDGKILIGGRFTSYKGVSANYIIRLNPDGTKDTSFNIGTGFNYIVKYITVQTDGKIIVGGEFITYKGVTENRIIRLNTDGTKDTSFNTGTGFNMSVNFIKIQIDGKIIVGGSFSSYKGVFESRIIRLNTNGTKDTSFNSGSGFNLNDNIYSIDIQTDGKIIVGGEFTSYNGEIGNRIIRLNTDGTKDNSFNIGTGFDNYVSSITIQSSGKILVGGNFTTFKDIGDSAFLIALHSEQSLATENFNNSNSFKISPNPVKDLLYIQSMDFTKINYVKIYDLLGKLVQQTTTTTIPVSSLAKGLYIIKITTEKGEVTKKFIKE